MRYNKIKKISEFFRSLIFKITAQQGSFYRTQNIAEGATCNIWEIWEAGNPHQENFKVPVTLKNRVEGAGSNFGFLFVGGEQVNSGDSPGLRYDIQNTIATGTTETTSNGFRVVSHKWIYGVDIAPTPIPNQFQSTNNFFTGTTNQTKEITREFKKVWPLTLKNSIVEAGGLSADEVFFKDPTTDNEFHLHLAAGNGFQSNDIFEALNIFVNGQDNQKYSVKSKSSFVFSGLNYFWTGGDFNPTTQTDLLVTGPTVLTATYKASLASSTTDAIASSSQRKIIRTPAVAGLPNGMLHCVYTSLNAVWYETSTDNGATWQLMNNNQPISANGGKAPSIAWCDNLDGAQAVLITYQQGTAIYLQCYTKTIPGIAFYYLTGSTIADDFDMPANANPVVTARKDGNTGSILVVWEGYYTYKNARIKGLPCRRADIQNTYSNPNFVQLALGSLWRVAGASPSATMASVTSAQFHSCFHVAWQDVTSEIRYCKLDDANLTPIEQFTVSANDGYTENCSPSIAIKNFQGNVFPRISWIGKRWVSDGGGESLAKTQAGGGGGGGHWEYATVFTKLELPGTFWVFGNTVVATNTTVNEDSSYIVAWSQGNFGRLNAYTRSTSLGGQIIPFRKSGALMSGKDIQVVPGSSWNNMCGMIQGTGSAPYPLQLSDNISTLGKVRSQTDIFNGRQGCVGKDTAQFYFLFGDVSVDGSSIGFEELSDTTMIDGVTTLNRCLATKPFTLKNTSSFTYDVQYGFVDSAACIAVLQAGDSVVFRIQLTDATSGELLGETDHVAFHAGDVFKYDNVGYEVQTEGLENRMVRLQLVVGTTLDARFALSRRFDVDPVTGLGKSVARTRQHLTVQAQKILSTYALEQNFPNPFNPTTNISYQLRDGGVVHLSVYDLLGRKIATLVDGYQNAGRHAATWDATDHPSAAYIYRISVVNANGKNSFNETRRMMLIK